MNKYLSNKFRWLAFIATWAVVCIHSRTERWNPMANDYGNALQPRIGDLFRFAVPLFFVISGYFFVSSYKKHGYLGMLKSKFWSLYVPMVLWSFVSLALLLPIRLYAQHDVPTVLDVVTVPLMHFNSGAIQFWYVRALIILTIALPLVALCMKRVWLCAVPMIAGMLIPQGTTAEHLHVPVTLFFFFGGILLAGGGGMYKYSLKTSSFLAVISAALLVVATLNVDIIGAHYFNSFVQPILMIAFLWFGYDVVAEKWGVKEYPSSLSGMFSVYCLHLITICWVQGVLRVALGVGATSRLVGYFASWLTFGLDVWIVNLLKCRLPRAYAVLSGGRGSVCRVDRERLEMREANVSAFSASKKKKKKETARMIEGQEMKTVSERWNHS